MNEFLTLLGNYINGAMLNRTIKVHGMDNLAAFGEHVHRLEWVISMEMATRGITINSYGLRPNAFA